MYERNTAKPHWKLRSTRQREMGKAKCVLDILCNMALVIYTFGMFAWIVFDAF